MLRTPTLQTRKENQAPTSANSLALVQQATSTQIQQYAGYRGSCGNTMLHVQRNVDCVLHDGASNLRNMKRKFAFDTPQSAFDSKKQKVWKGAEKFVSSVSKKFGSMFNSPRKGYPKIPISHDIVQYGMQHDQKQIIDWFDNKGAELQDLKEALGSSLSNTPNPLETDVLSQFGKDAMQTFESAKRQLLSHSSSALALVQLPRQDHHISCQCANCGGSGGHQLLQIANQTSNPDTQNEVDETARLLIAAEAEGSRLEIGTVIPEKSYSYGENF